MARRVEEKERRRQERLAREQEELRQQRRARRRRITLAVVAGLVLVGAVAVWQPWRTDPESAFAYDAGGAEERASAAGVRFGADSHEHSKVTVLVGQEPVEVPGDMGAAVPLQTHDADGLIHIEGAEAPTLGQFMAIWGVEFGRDRLGTYRNSGARRVRMWVKDPKAKTFREMPPAGSLRLQDEQEIYLYYGPPQQAPIS